MTKTRGRVPIHPHQADMLGAARKLRAIILRTASRRFFWESGGNEGGLYLQNSTHNPLPIRLRLMSRRGDSFVKRVSATLTTQKFFDHLFGINCRLFITNDQAADVWHLALDNDDDRDGSLSTRMNTEAIKGRGFLSRSRGNGHHVHFKLNRAGTPTDQAIERIKAVAAALRTRYSSGTEDAHFESIKGIPVVVRANGSFDFDLAQSRIDYAFEHYHESWMIGMPEWKAYERYAVSYGERFEPVPQLEVTTVHFDRDNSMLVPCANKTDRSVVQTLNMLERYLTWAGSAPMLTLDELERFCGLVRLPEQRPLEPAPVKIPAPPSTGQQVIEQRIEEILRHRDDDDVPTGLFPRSSRTATMIKSTDKPRSRLGAVFAALQKHGDQGRDFISRAAHSIYTQHGAASDDLFDAKRQRSLGSAYSFAMRTFDDSKRSLGSIALNALDQQSGGGKRVTEDKVAKLSRRLQPLIRRGLKHTSVKAIAVAVLTFDLNKHRHETGDLPAAVRRCREHREYARRIPGMRPMTGDMPIPTTALRGNERKSGSVGMLGYFGLRRNGSAIREINEVLVELGAAECTDPRYCSGVFDEHGKKIGEGRCRRWKAGAGLVELLKGIHDTAGADTSMSDTQLYVVRRDHAPASDSFDAPLPGPQRWHHDFLNAGMNAVPRENQENVAA